MDVRKRRSKKLMRVMHSSLASDERSTLMKSSPEKMSIDHVVGQRMSRFTLKDDVMMKCVILPRTGASPEGVRARGWRGVGGKGRVRVRVALARRILIFSVELFHSAPSVSPTERVPWATPRSLRPRRMRAVVLPASLSDVRKTVLVSRDGGLDGGLGGADALTSWLSSSLSALVPPARLPPMRRIAFFSLASRAALRSSASSGSPVQYHRRKSRPISAAKMPNAMPRCMPIFTSWSSALYSSTLTVDFSSLHGLHSPPVR